LIQPIWDISGAGMTGAGAMELNYGNSFFFLPR